MQVVFRADASSSIGSGHVVRCLTLAQALRKAGGEVLFVCREHKGHLADWIGAEGHSVVLLPLQTSSDDGSYRYAGWLGADVATDASQTIAAIQSAGFKPAWVIVDHYAIDAYWERRVGDSGSLIMAIDDVADRLHDCDILLDQNLVPNMYTRYSGLVPQRAVQLLGPRYVLLQSSYRQWHDQIVDRSADPARLFCYFGASDPHGLSLAALEAVLDLKLPDLRADFVLGPYATDRRRIIELAGGHAGIVIHEKLPSLAELMVEADLALGAGGATSWERICLGLPALVVTLAENQRPIASALHELHLVYWLGDGRSTGRAEFRVALQNNLRPQGTGWFDRNFASGIDGRGADRVVNAILDRMGERQI